jgi:outer membrane protein
MRRLHVYILIGMLLIMQSAFGQKTLSLDDCKQLAFKNNAKSKISKLEIEVSRQVKKSAFTNYFPSISAGGMMWGAQKNLMEIQTAGGDLPVYDGNPANLASATQYAYFPSTTTGLMKKGTIGFVNAIQPVFMGGRIYYGNKLAALGETVADDKDKMTTNEISLKTEEQYWQIVSLREKANTINAYETLLRRLLNQVEDAFNHGVTTKNDVLKVRVKLNEVLLNKSKLENGTHLAEMAFCQYIGIPFDSTMIFKDSLAINGIPQSYYVEKNEALKQRTEYSLLEKSVEAERLQTKIKLGEYLPQVAVGANEMYMKLDDADSRTVGMVFGTVSVPISSWWSGSHELEERSIKEEIAKNNFKDNSELLTLQIEKAWQDLSDSYKQYLLCLDSKGQAEENMKVNDDSFKNGVINISDLLESKAMLQQTQDQLTDAKASYATKLSLYLQITGR